LVGGGRRRAGHEAVEQAADGGLVDHDARDAADDRREVREARGERQRDAPHRETGDFLLDLRHVTSAGPVPFMTPAGILTRPFSAFGQSCAG